MTTLNQVILSNVRHGGTTYIQVEMKEELLNMILTLVQIKTQSVPL